MHLSPQQIERFYHIWFELLRYVNEQRHLVPTFPATPEKAALPTSDALQLRNALWADNTLRKSFIATNPAGLSPNDLELIASWQYRLAGNFFIMRHLKKYTVFLSETPNHAYGVLGLVSPIEEIVGPFLPIYVQAVLLPFEDQIIYDSLLEPYRIAFGSGIRSGLNDTYRNLQEREGIITSLVPTEASSDLNVVRKAVLARNKKILNAFQKDLASRGLSNKMIEQHVGTIENFAHTNLLTQDPPHGLLDTTFADMQTYLRSAENKTTMTSFKRFVRFLLETGRMDYEQAESLLDALKHAKE